MTLFYPQDRYLCQVPGTAQVALKDITHGLPWLVGCLSETDRGPVDHGTMAVPWSEFPGSPGSSNPQEIRVRETLFFSESAPEVTTGV